MGFCPFQSTRPCGARQLIAPQCPLQLQFQSTRPCGARLWIVVQPPVVWRFQSTRPCGARHHRPQGMPQPGKFQSTRPCGARPPQGIDHYPLPMFQSTRPCGARLDYPRIWWRIQHVSIHAPLRGATASFCAAQDLPNCFNPRAPAGRDRPFTNPCHQRVGHRLSANLLPPTALPHHIPTPPINKTRNIKRLHQPRTYRDFPVYFGFAMPFRQQAAPPDQKTPWPPHAPPDGASWNRESNSAGCRLPDQSPPPDAA